MLDTAGQSLTLDIAFIDGTALTAARSRQRYDRQGCRRIRYVDLGLAVSKLIVDDVGLVLHYEHLFQRVTLPA